MSCLAGEIAFAWHRLHLVAELSGCHVEEVFDRWFEGVRHALMNMHSFMGRADAQSIVPLVDLLTSLHCGCFEPVGTGLLHPRALAYLSGSGIWSMTSRWCWLRKFSFASS